MVRVVMALVLTVAQCWVVVVMIDREDMIVMETGIGNLRELVLNNGFVITILLLSLHYHHCPTGDGGGGMLCLYTLKNPSTPEQVFRAPCGVTCLAFHPKVSTTLRSGPSLQATKPYIDDTV